MNRLQTLILSFLFLSLLSLPAFAAPAKNPIEITLPATLIQEIIEKALPVNIPIDSQTVLGAVSVDAIKNIKLHKNKLSGHVTLSGHELNLVTNIAGHKLRMRIGSLTMSFQCNASIRFDAKHQTLHIKPVITELHASDQAKTEVAALIAQLFNGQEFPIKLNKLKPVSVDTDNKTLQIAMHVNGISVHSGEIHLQATPAITVTGKTTPATKKQ